MPPTLDQAPGALFVDQPRTGATVASLRKALLFLLRPQHLITILWMLCFLKTVEGFSRWDPDPLFKTGTSLLFVGILLLALYAHNGQANWALEAHASWLLPLAAGAAIAWTLPFLAGFFERFGYRLAPAAVPQLGILFVALAVAGWLIRRRCTSARFQLLFLGSCWLVMSLALVVAIRSFPLHGGRSDMLPLIVAAIKAWFSGKSPYQPHWADTHFIPLTYFPALWLPYVPLVAAGIDPRWIIVPAQLAFIGIQWVAFRFQLAKGWWSYLIWIALNPYLLLRHEIHVVPMWAIIALMLLFTVRKHWLAAAVTWGILLACRQTLWFPYPLFLILVFRQLGWRRTLLNGGITALTALLFAAPFLAQSPAGFVSGTLLYWTDRGNTLSTATVAAITHRMSGFSLIPLAYLLGVGPYVAFVRLIQAAGLLLLYAFAATRKLNVAGTLRLMALSLLWALLLNLPTNEVYMYAEPLIIAAFAIYARETPSAAEARSGELRLPIPSVQRL